MLRIDTVKEAVMHQLMHNPATRGSDRLMILKVYESFGVSGSDSIESVLMDPDLPGFETIRRARQKLQAEFPELKADKAVEAMRAELETEYRDFARS